MMRISNVRISPNDEREYLGNKKSMRCPFFLTITEEQGVRRGEHRNIKLS